MRPILRPGVHLLRRDSHTLQLGLDPAERVTLPDTPATRRMVMEPSATLPSLGRVLLPDDSTVRAALPTDDGEASTLWRRAAVAATARAGTPNPPEPNRLRVHPYGGRLSELIADDLGTLLQRCGVAAPRTATRKLRPSRARPEIHVVVGVGEPARGRLDARMAQGIPHLLLRFVEGRALLGPFVEPGSSACLRCIDLQHCETDPAWPLLVEQYSRFTRQDRPDGVPEPLDPVLAATALAWTAREVLTRLTGGVPTTRSRVLVLSADLAEITLHEHRPRPECGCRDR